MPIPFVLVEVASTGAPPEYPAALVAACSQAIDEGACVLSDASEPPEQVRAVAIVTWQGPDQLSVRVQVGLRRGDQPKWLTSDLRFQQADDRLERWKTVGYAIRTLVGEWEKGAPPPKRLPAPGAMGSGPQPQPSRVDHSSPAAAAAAAPRSNQRPTRWVGAGALVGPGLDSGTWRAGAWGELAQVLGSMPLFVAISGSYALRGADDRGLSAQWVTLGAGLGAFGSLGPSGLDLRLQLQLLADHLQASARDPVSTRTETASLWTPGLRAGLSAAWPVTRPAALLVGIDGWTLWQTASIRIAGVQTATAPSLGMRFLLGAQFALP
jgi:hypothetical protein